MKLFLLVLCVGAVSAISHELPEHVASREDEPDPREFRPFKMPAMIKHVCESLRRFLEQSRDGARPRNALQLSQLFVTEFDTNGDKCISGTEIRDIAARFRGILSGYRTIFEHVLDENRSGCVEAEELNSLVLDCIMPSATWMRGVPDTERYSLPFEREDIARILEEREPEEDVLVEEEVDEKVAELSKEEEDTADRRAMLEEEKAAVTETQLNPAVKEMICSMMRREHEDPEFAIKSLAEIVDTDGQEGLSYNEMYELLAGSRIPREEADDLAGVMDVDNDGVVTVVELMTAVDHCPIPEVIDVPVVNNRPRVNFVEVECPSQAALYKEMRTRVMKFIGSRQIKFEEAMQAAEEFYISITGDVEEVIEPKDLDIPIDCVKEAWQDIDSDKNGFLDLLEFNRVALDVFEEFLPKPVRNTNALRNARLEVEDEVITAELETVPREEVNTLAVLVQRLCRQAGVRLPEGDVERVIGILLQDPGVAALFEKVQSTGLVTDEAEATLSSLIQPIIYQLFSE